MHRTMAIRCRQLVEAMAFQYTIATGELEVHREQFILGLPSSLNLSSINYAWRPRVMV